MSTKKAGGTASNLTDSGPQYLGVKLYDGQRAKTGSIIIRQRGSKYDAGANVGIGKDYTLFALTEGTVRFGKHRKHKFNGDVVMKSIVSVE